MLGLLDHKQYSLAHMLDFLVHMQYSPEFSLYLLDRELCWLVNMPHWLEHTLDQHHHQDQMVQMDLEDLVDHQQDQMDPEDLVVLQHLMLRPVDLVVLLSLVVPAVPEDQYCLEHLVDLADQQHLADLVDHQQEQLN